MKTLNDADTNQSYTINKIDTTDSEVKKFLFTLGCYEGETITIISRLRDNLIVNIKDARYSIDSNLANIILID